MLYNRVNIVFPGAIQGVYNFNSLSNFLSGNYSTFQQAFGAPSQFQSNPNIGFFGQDEWRVEPNLTINAGLRYDLQFLPESNPNGYEQPRAASGFCLRARRSQDSDARQLWFLLRSNSASRDFERLATRRQQVHRSATFAGTTGRAGLPERAGGCSRQRCRRNQTSRASIQIFETSYSEQGSVQIERQLPGNALLSVGYIHLRGLHIIASRNVNVPTVPASAGIPNLGRPDPNWGNIGRFEGSGDSYYNGMVVSFNIRIGSWASVRVSYTLSKTTDDAGNFFFSTPQNNFDLRDDMGRSDNDQRHRLVVSGSLRAPEGKRHGWQSALHGFQLSYIFTYASRLPFNVLLGSDRNFDTNNNDRPVGVGRNTGKGFDFASLDLRVSRRFHLTERVRLEMLAEGFNVLNRANYGVPNNTFGPGITPLPTFGQPTQAFDPRQLQFGLKLSF